MVVAIVGRVARDIACRDTPDRQLVMQFGIIAAFAA